MNSISLIILGYICGSIPFGKVISSTYGIDIQRRGSGNIGFANVRRIIGWRAGLLTLVGDISKGALPTALAILTTPSLAFLVGLAAILGHIFPLWLKFRGGKGIATGLGVVAIIAPAAAIAGCGVYIAGCFFFKKSGIASLLGTVSVAVVGSLLQPTHTWQFVLLLAIAGWTLRANIRGTVPDYDA